MWPFPQPSFLSYGDVKWGATASTAAMGMLATVSAAPSFWLMGALAGGLFGYETGQSFEHESHTTPRGNVLKILVLYNGKRLAKASS